MAHTREASVIHISVGDLRKYPKEIQPQRADTPSNADASQTLINATLLETVVGPFLKKVFSPPSRRS